MATKEMITLSPKYITLKHPFRKSVEMLEELRKTAEEALDEEKAKDYAQSMKDSAKTVQRSVGSMKRALAGFDQLNRMNRLKTSSEGKSQEQMLLEYLNSVNFKEIISKLQLVKNQIAMLTETMNGVIDQVYLTDFALKMQENSLQRHATVWQSVGGYINTVATAQQRLTQMITQWYTQANQMTVMLGTLKTHLASLQVNLQGVAMQMTNTQVHGVNLLSQWKTLQESAGTLSSLLSVLRARLIGLFDSQVQQSLAGADNQLKQRLFLMQNYLQSGFFPQWKQAWTQIAGAVTTQMDAVPQGIQAVLNTTVDLFNSFLSKLTSGFNSWIQSANQLQARLGLISGTPVQRLPMMTTPKIPRLAQGAVLPAGKPFLAVVGDQRHGTNVEAPLATIQEAVANVMQDSISANMAGHEATVQVLKQILEAVLGISIGDDVIGTAVQRYRSKMAVVMGGAV